jgi:hypothetical protein
VYGCYKSCRRPTGIDAVGYDWTQVQAKTNFLDLKRFENEFTCDWKCGYTGVAHGHCTSTGIEYKLSGTCAPNGCTQPPKTKGYLFTMATGSCSPGSCAIASSILCDYVDGFTGKPVVTACTKAGEPYTLSGCKIEDATKKYTGGGTTILNATEMIKAMSKGTTGAAYPVAPSGPLAVLTAAAVLSRMFA